MIGRDEPLVSAMSCQRDLSKARISLELNVSKSAINSGEVSMWTMRAAGVIVASERGRGAR